MPTKLIRNAYPSLVGLLLGLLQTGLFFQLTFTLSSGFTTFLLITLCWLLGSGLGVLYVARSGWSLRTVLILALVAYALCSGLVTLTPFNARLWPVYAILIVVTGVFPGVFFAQLTPIYRARVLFFRENNGFVLGLILGTILFMLAGRVVLWVGPFALAVVIYLTSTYHALGENV